MSEIVIEVKDLKKKYRIGKADKRSDTVWEAIINGLKYPLKNLRQIRSMSNVKNDDDSIFWALKDVSFKVNEGEVLGIIGHNGAGKSTLLKILSRITEPSAGEVRLKGRVAALLEVGTGFHPELTGRENVYMNGTILGMRKREIDAKLEEIIDFSGVEKYLDTPVKFYSSGMRVRLGFSVAAHLEPEILIIDEVLAVGDAEFQRKCLGKMESVANQGRTVIFVSHYMEAVGALCQRGILLEQGKIKFDGPVEEAIQAYSKIGSDHARLEELLVTSPRGGSGSIKFKNIWLESESGIKADTFRSSQTITFVFEISNTSIFPVSKISCGFAIYNEKNTVIARYFSHYDDIHFSMSGNTCILKCKISELNLGPGMYFIRARVLDNGVEADRPLGYVGTFTVTLADFYKVPGYQQNEYGPLLLKGEWSML